jgi:acetyl esterase/lipase
MVTVARTLLAAMAVVGLGSVGCAADGAPLGPTEVPDGATRERLRYGGHDVAFGDLWIPAPATAGADGDRPVPVVVLVHGGFWRDAFGLDLMDGLAASLVDAGYAAWNIEYRRLGSGGGYPETFLDVAAAVDHLADVARDRGLDLDRVAVVGHSAGGHLATWIAGRHALASGAPGADPVVRPIVAFPQAGVLDLEDCAGAGLGGGACVELLGGAPAEVPDRYDVASPLSQLPLDVPIIPVHGTADDIVPPSQSEGYVEAAMGAGDPAALVLVDGADHFDVIDPAHPAWREVLDRLPAFLG